MAATSEKIEGSEAKKLCIVVPCFDESEVIRVSARHLQRILECCVDRGLAARESFILLVDDGSVDKTWDIIKELHAASSCIDGIRLARNSGHQDALYAGLSEAIGRADFLVTIDADLQDDPEAIFEMLEKANSGAEVVLGVRSSRASDSLPKRLFAGAFYRGARALGVPTVPHHADFRLVTSVALARMLATNERRIYWRAAALTVSDQVETVSYARRERSAGVSKYPANKMLKLAIEAVLSWSSVPLRAMSLLGLAVAFASFLAIIYVVLSLLLDRIVEGWVSVTASLYFLAGVILLGIGTLGEYVHQILIQVKGRQTFFVSERLIHGTRDGLAP